MRSWASPGNFQRGARFSAEKLFTFLCVKGLKQPFFAIFRVLRQDMGYLIPAERKIVDFRSPAAKKSVFLCFRLNLGVFTVSAEGASEKKIVYDAIIFKFLEGNSPPPCPSPPPIPLSPEVEDRKLHKQEPKFKPGEGWGYPKFDNQLNQINALPT